MQVTETESAGLKRELKVVVEAAELSERLSNRLEELKSQIRLKGFRPGKVPVSHIKKVYGRSIMAEILEQAVVETSQKALTDREERPAYQPDITLPDDKDEIENVIAGDADLAYTMAFEVLPDIEVTDLAGLDLEKPVAEIEEEAIEKAITQLVEGSVSYVAKDGPAEDGDQVTLDFEGKLGDEPFEGGKAEDAQVVLGRGRFIPGFEEGLLKVKAGETKTIETTFPDDYSAEQLAGKTATFDVTVKEVAEPVLPKVDDDFAKTLGFENVEALRGAVTGRLGEEYEMASRSKLKRSLLDSLNTAHTFDLPSQLVDREFDTIWQQVTSELENAGKGFEDEDTTEEKAREEYRGIAERRVRLGLVLSDIGEKQEIRVTDEEVQKALMERIQQFPGQERMVFEYYQKNPEALGEFRAPIFEDKVVDYILELANVKEKKVSSEDLFAVDETAE
ncbi:MAG: trigger factor [Hyphomicrobiales bacterium]|nr:trigger factor [Hyphomicrobiales bacterium]